MRIKLLLGLLLLSGCGNGVAVIVGSDGTACLKKVNGKYQSIDCDDLTKDERENARWIDAAGMKVN